MQVTNKFININSKFKIKSEEMMNVIIKTAEVQWDITNNVLKTERM